jgi:hypothetical protein
VSRGSGGTPASDVDIQLSTADRAIVASGGNIGIGTHHAVVDGDLVDLYMESVTMTLPEVIYLARIFEAIQQSRGRFFLLTRNTTPMTSDVRQWIGQWGRRHPIGGVAIIDDGNRISNTLLSLVARALSVLQQTPVPLRFFAREEQARAWLAELRR